MQIGRFLIGSLLIALAGSAPSAMGLDHVTLKRDGKQIQIEGKLLVTAQDGGLLVQARDGLLWTIPPEEQVKQTQDNVPFRPMTAEEISRQLLAKLPAGFDVHRTAHYLIFYDTSKAYANWCGALFEGLHRAFTNTWSRRGFSLAEPQFPLIAIVFADRRSYLEFSKAELGQAGSAIIGYFSLRTNRMQMYDLTGIESLRQNGARRAASIPIGRILAQPEARRQVSTIIHEATHQIAFNCGLHARYSDCPTWFSEGIAIYFETPDLSSSKGWRGIGEVNYGRLTHFRQYLRRRGADSLKRLLADDKRFHDTSTSLDAYAEAWSLTYFLIRQYPKQYVSYLKLLSTKPPLVWDGPQARLREFTSIFGDLERLDAAFLRYMARVR